MFAKDPTVAASFAACLVLLFVHMHLRYTRTPQACPTSIQIRTQYVYCASVSFYLFHNSGTSEMVDRLKKIKLPFLEKDEQSNEVRHKQQDK